jgi:hypothetical protein
MGRCPSFFAGLTEPIFTDKPEPGPVFRLLFLLKIIKKSGYAVALDQQTGEHM